MYKKLGKLAYKKNPCALNVPEFYQNMNQQSSNSVMSGSLVKLATALVLLLLLMGELAATSALVPSGREKSPSNVLFGGSSLRKMFPGKDGYSRRENLVISRNRKLQKVGKVQPSPPSPTRNQQKIMGVPPAPPPPIPY
ncbi:hypothetical protein QUC31_007056 [Theobroma cacao]|uniref:Uncharacterized protein n=1 Tax=Theobroma cacao TaxID=3641 RepID=A0A061FUU1_THECC|nr:Uncharacterized protein TCM_012182 [Theobroma cacao]WRX19471.1 hypothetical protein QQP08_011958 [Theobroma cacao]